MVPWWKPEIGPQEYAQVKAVLESNYINEGDVTSEFESQIAQLVGAKYAIAVTSGTAALTLALAGFGVGSGDEVIVPDITFIATANAVVLAGAKPVLVDVHRQTLTIDPVAAEQAITSRTKAIVPVHVSGRAADMQPLLQLAKRRDLVIIEDAAEALMSRHMGRYLGTIGDAGCLSFSPNKTITTGQGGMILTNHEHLYVRLRELKDQGRPVRGTGGDDIHRSIGFNFKFTNIQAAIGLAQLEYLQTRLDRMRRIRQMYAANLAGIPGFELLPFRLDEGEMPQWTDAILEKRNELDAFLLSRDIHCRRFWFPIHSQAPYRTADELFPVSTALSPRAIWLPSAFTLSDEDVNRVCECIGEFLAQNAPRTYIETAAIEELS